MVEAPLSGLPETARQISDFQKLIGWKVKVWEEGYAVITCEIRQDFMNRSGILHGGLIATLLDSVAGHAAFGAPPADPAEPRLGGVTLSFTINYLGTASEGELTVTGRRTGGGKSIVFARADVVDAAGRLIAEATGTFKRRLPKA
ncbi:MAG: PaaI family thioesterase [Rhizobiales bacterium]|nr:PaaI family thioesterase [Hyphomicrobiales bacterium]